MPDQVCDKMLAARVRRNLQFENLGNNNSLKKVDIWPIIRRELLEDGSEVKENPWLQRWDESVCDEKLHAKWDYARSVAKSYMAKIKKS